MGEVAFIIEDRSYTDESSSSLCEKSVHIEDATGSKYSKQSPQLETSHQERLRNRVPYWTRPLVLESAALVFHVVVIL